jgi:N-acetylglucosamine kinase-like BadF-type ATPase
MLGDEGSGVWIAREAARLVLARVEQGSRRGALDDALMAQCGADDPQMLIANLHAMHEPKQWAALARVVFETAEVDAGSREIIVRAADALAQIAVPLQKLIAGPIVIAGGLLLNQPRLEEAVRRAVPQTRCIRLEDPPVEGALRLAEGLLG